MKGYFRKNFDYGELVNVCRKALTIPQNLNCSSDKDFKCVKNHHLLNNNFILACTLFNVCCLYIF